jgi:hypothetical protein
MGDFRIQAFPQNVLSGMCNIEKTVRVHAARLLHLFIFSTVAAEYQLFLMAEM